MVLTTVSTSWNMHMNHGEKTKEWNLSCSCKLLTCLQVALLCVQENADDRPTMLEVYSMLKSDNEAAVLIPTKMAFSGKRYGNVASPITPTSQQASSVNDAQISELLPR